MWFFLKNICYFKIYPYLTVSDKIKYLEFNSPGTEIAWDLKAVITPPATTAAVPEPSYTGLIVLSPVNIKLGTHITVTAATYIAAKMYVGGTFTNTNGYNGYYGSTATNAATMYITYCETIIKVGAGSAPRVHLSIKTQSHHKMMPGMSETSLCDK